MLNRVSKPNYEPPPEGDTQTLTIDLPSVVAFFRRRFWIIASMMAISGLAGIAYAKIAPKTFTATAQLLIDTRKLDVFRGQAVVEDPTINNSAVESQMQILRSEQIARSVIRHPDLKLLETDEFGGGGPTFIGSLAEKLDRVWPAAGGAVDALRSGDWVPVWLRGEPEAAPSRELLLQRAVQSFDNQLEVKRIGLSYVIEIEFTSYDRERAAKVANKIATAYINDQLASKSDAAERASDWLQARMAELREQASGSDRAVQTFKVENNIINAGDGLITDQQVQELSKQRILAETNVAEAKARFERIKAVNTSSSVDASVTDAMENPVFVRLQQQYLDLQRQQDALAARYGRDHRTVVALDREIAEVRENVRSELRRLEETYKSDYEIASTRLSQLQTALEKVVGTSAKSLQAQVQLRELESTANSYSNLYNSFLERYIQTVQQQSFPGTEAKLITPATTPLRGSGPGGSLILAGALAFGGFLGCGVAVARELLDSVIRTSDQLERLTGIETLGVLPIVKRKARRRDPGEASVMGENGIVAPLSSRLTTVLDGPFTHYAETIRSIKLASDMFCAHRQMKVIGLVSAMPGEGKSMVSINLAFLMAQTKGRTLLIDADLRNPSLSRSVSPHTDGLLQILEGTSDLEAAMRLHAPSGLHFLSAGVERKIANTGEFLCSREMEELLMRAREEFDHVIIDLPPLVPVVDARAAAHLIDGFVLVVEWGKTSSDVLHRALRGSRPVSQKLVGSVLNKVDLTVLGRYENLRSSYYANEYLEEPA